MAKKTLVEALTGQVTPRPLSLTAQEVANALKRPLHEGSMGSIGSSPPTEELKRDYVQYMRDGNTFKPVGDVTLVDNLSPCAYQINLTMSGCAFERIKPRTDELMVFEHSNMDKVVKEIDRFWERKVHYEKLGLMHSRGILLYGPPGTGKSACLQQVVEMMVKRGDAVFFAKSTDAIVEGLKAFRQVEPNRRVVVCFEEADELVRYNERPLLQLMDGDAKTDNVLYLGCPTPDQRVLTRDLRWIKAGDIKAGDQLWTFDENNHGYGRKYRPGTVVSSIPGRKPCVRVYFENGESFTCSEDHPWLASEGGRDDGHGPNCWVAARDLCKKKYYCLRPFKTWDEDTSYSAGWLSGMLDGEGTLGTGRGNRKYNVAAAQVKGPVLDRLSSLFSSYVEARLDYLVPANRKHQTQGRIYTLGGLTESARLLGVIRPGRLLSKFDIAGARMQGPRMLAVAVEHIGEQDIQSIETSTHTFIIEGFAQHNTTNYIDRLPPRMLRPGRFDKKIYIAPPTFEERLKYLRHKLHGLSEDAQIVDLARKSNGFGFGHLRELIAGTFAMNEPVDDVLARLRAPVNESNVVRRLLASVS